MSAVRQWTILSIFWAVNVITGPHIVAQEPPQVGGTVVRFATFNVAFNRREAGQLAQDLDSGRHPKARQIAEIIQRVRPHVLLLNEVDYDADGRAAQLFLDKYLNVGQGNQQPIQYEYHFTAEVNTGVPSGLDLDQNGRTDDPGDAFGFGAFPGQYGMLVLSRYPIDPAHVRTFQKFLWKDMPQAALPVDPESQTPYYSSTVLDKFRLSSKSHWDVPIRIGEQTVHLLASHPTPPVFDGREDRNGCRNHDEIRLWADYVHPDHGDYLVDDEGRRGGLSEGERFVIVGDQNADPMDGDSRNRAINQLLEHAHIQPTIPTSEGAVAAAAAQGRKNLEQTSDPATDTGDFNDRSTGNLRVDYVLPSKNLHVVGQGVFWPAPEQPGSDLVRASDHRLVWIDVQL
ncbi:MAG: endonuclease/exonuclease/phosphatase family protein [Planctomycetales bacterium]|nr:endonuclease/exonuclease/phosphatase family protein [Planctomycetales bacterium]